MAEVIKSRLRVKQMFMGEPITEEAKVATQEWGNALPVTLRDDELLITEEAPEEEPVHSHENDSPEEVDFTGKGLKMTGSFIRATREQLKTMLGGDVKETKYHHSTTKLNLNKAFKIVCHDGSEVVIPNADGYVLLNLALGKGAVSKFPFSFNLKRASASWDCDLIF